MLQEEAKSNGQSMSQYLIQAVNDRAGRQILTPAGAETASAPEE